MRTAWGRTEQDLPVGRGKEGNKGSETTTASAEGSLLFSLGLCCGVSLAAPEAWQVCSRDPGDPFKGQSNRSTGDSASKGMRGFPNPSDFWENVRFQTSIPK